ncbi:MAG: UvrD-helicase domain-containing protein [Gammaproteobacteria bacterium]|nr:UvrD-helicase domain-containing protein [Gammaproteobacteria bacterium]MDH3751513.1 UvrD-helicase domain-containing protein [Gammaproteobacteria bacterium]
MTRDDQLLHDDHEARVAALDVSRSFIVQAPAGSGKTELLIQRYLKLMATVEYPEEILAITFTRKAAVEMQLRVLQALRNAMHDDDPDEPHERLTAQAAKAVLRRDAQLQWDLIANPRRMRIQTLDSLNAAIARTQPLTSTGGAAGNAIIADAQMRTLYRDAAALTLDQLAETGTARDATEQVLLHVDNNTAIYVAYLARMLATRDQWLPFVGSGLVDADEANDLRYRFERSLENVVVHHLELTRDAVPPESVAELARLSAYAAEHLIEAGQVHSPIAALHGMVELPDVMAGTLQQWLGVAELLQTKQGQWRKRVNKNQGFPAGDSGQKNALHDLLESLSDRDECRKSIHETRILPPVSYSDEQWSVLLALFRLLPLAVTELKRLFAERSVSDHIEVALTASDALGTADAPGDIALLLDYQLRHLLVDEMQDTSSAQYRMLEALTGGWDRGDGRTLYCVGDPMQSIYRFRNAEVGQFLLAKKGGIGSVTLNLLTLRRNFRSGEKLVDWFNQVFPVVLAPHDDPQRSAVSYAAAVSVPTYAGQGHCVVHPLIGSDTDAEADVGFKLIQEVLDTNPDDDMAVLVRSRTHLPQLLYRLRKAGIPYRAVEIDRLTDLPEIMDVLALTRAMVHAGDRLAWLAVLRSPWLGLDWSDLHALVKNDMSSTVWERLHDEAVVSRLSDYGRKAVAGFCKILMNTLASCRAESLRDRIEKAWLQLGGPAILEDAHAIDNVYRYLDVIEKIEVAGSLPNVAELEAALDMEHVSSDTNARLQVMTIHRAKGLQFDHVLLTGLGRVPRTREQTVLSWFDIPDEHGRPQKVISPVGPRAELERDPMHGYIGNVQTEKDKNELGRLLYVACTRARKSLHLLGNARMSRNGLRADPRSLLYLLWPMVADQFESAVDADAQETDDGGADAYLMPVLRRFERPWKTPAAPPLPGEPDAVKAAAEILPVEFYWVGAGARLAGTLVHRWLQMAADGRIDLQANGRGPIQHASERWLHKAGLNADAITPIIDRVDAALRGIITDEKGRWLLEGEGHAELPLSGVINGRVESVVLDRVRIDGDGNHWIVDYKTSSHEGGDLAGFLAAETDRYRPQLAKYAELYRNFANVDVRCALYFPLLQEFVEVRL